MSIYITKNKGKGLIENLTGEDLLEIEKDVEVVYNQNYSTEETKTGGTWIDGKPIYTITQLTTDAPPSDMETEFPTETIGDYTMYKYTKTTNSPA